MNHDLENVQRLAKKLHENLAKCADDPAVDPVHDTRTGTRRLQATLEDLVRGLPEDGGKNSLHNSATATMKMLKRIRQEAGPVRDLDVHRKLLDKLIQRAVRGGENGPKEAQEPRSAEIPGQPDILETPEAGLRTTSVEQQADDLDTWLKHRRNQLADGLKAEAKDLDTKLNHRLRDLGMALSTGRARRGRKKPPGVVALDSFARLASEMQVLDAGNLHDFRKGAKKARYVAELAAQGDAQAQRVSVTLKKLQDEIGDWHDWLVLAEEAHAALGGQGAELIGLVEAERERHFVAAMKTVAKLRGRLMGEWLAMKPAFGVRRSAIGRTAVGRGYPE